MHPKYRIFRKIVRICALCIGLVSDMLSVKHNPVFVKVTKII